MTFVKCRIHFVFDLGIGVKIKHTAKHIAIEHCLDPSEKIRNALKFHKAYDVDFRAIYYLTAHVNSINCMGQKLN